MSANSNHFYFDYKDGKYGYNTDPNRGADSFVPFKSASNISEVKVAYGTDGTTFTATKSGICIVSVERNNGYNTPINISLTLNRVTINPIWSHQPNLAALTRCYLFEINEGDKIVITSTGATGANYNSSFYYIAIV